MFRDPFSVLISDIPKHMDSNKDQMSQNSSDEKSELSLHACVKVSSVTCLSV